MRHTQTVVSESRFCPCLLARAMPLIFFSLFRGIFVTSCRSLGRVCLLSLRPGSLFLSSLLFLSTWFVAFPVFPLHCRSFSQVSALAEEELPPLPERSTWARAQLAGTASRQPWAPDKPKPFSKMYVYCKLWAATYTLVTSVPVRISAFMGEIKKSKNIYIVLMVLANA